MLFFFFKQKTAYEISSISERSFSTWRSTLSHKPCRHPVGQTFLSDHPQTFLSVFSFPRTGVGTPQSYTRRALFCCCSVLVYLALVGFGIQHDDGIVGRTQKNGNGCTCHNLVSNSSVKVWLTGPANVIVGSN